MTALSAPLGEALSSSVTGPSTGRSTGPSAGSATGRGARRLAVVRGLYGTGLVVVGVRRSWQRWTAGERFDGSDAFLLALGLRHAVQGLARGLGLTTRRMDLLLDGTHLASTIAVAGTVPEHRNAAGAASAEAAVWTAADRLVG